MPGSTKLYLKEKKCCKGFTKKSHLSFELNSPDKCRMTRQNKNTSGYSLLKVLKELVNIKKE